MFGLVETEHKDCEKLIESIGATVKPVTVERNGHTISEKPRPDKVVMGTLSDKKEVTRRLCNLQFCDGYVEEERLIVKIWIKEAKQRNEREFVNKWVIRGSPRTGMRLLQRLAK